MVGLVCNQSIERIERRIGTSKITHESENSDLRSEKRCRHILLRPIHCSSTCVSWFSTVFLIFACFLFLLSRLPSLWSCLSDTRDRAKSKRRGVILATCFNDKETFQWPINCKLLRRNFTTIFVNRLKKQLSENSRLCSASIPENKAKPTVGHSHTSSPLLCFCIGGNVTEVVSGSETFLYTSHLPVDSSATCGVFVIASWRQDPAITVKDRRLGIAVELTRFASDRAYALSARTPCFPP